MRKKDKTFTHTVENRLSRTDFLKQIAGFIRNSPIGAHFYEVKDNTLIFRGGNASADRILHIEHDKLIGLSIDKAFPGLANTDIPVVYLNIALNGAAWNSNEVLYKRGDKEEFYRVNAFQTSPGNMMALFTDITEMKQIEITLKLKNEELLSTEEELREKNEKLNVLNELLQHQNDQLKQTYDLLQESEEKFRAAFKTSPDSVNINRISDGLYVEINEGFTQLTGYTQEDIEGKTSFDINIWNDPSDRQRVISAIRESGKVVNIEAKFRLKNGNIRTGLMSASLFRFRNENYILSVTRDIQEIVEARASIRESEERFRQFAENIDDVFWLTEGNKVLYLNTAVERKFGYSRENFAQSIQQVADVIYPEDLPIYEQLVHFKLENAAVSITRQLRVIDSNGKIRWIWVRLFPIFDKNDNLFRVAGIASDFTLQKDIENELRLAKEKAQESDHLKSTFLANLSHEIRTPMNGIIGFAGLLTKQVPNNPICDHYVDIINKCNEQLLHIIDDLVDISKIEVNQMKLIELECNLTSLMEDLFLMYSKELENADKKHILLHKHFELENDETIIITDEYRLRQVLMNLLNNAIKFTHQGQIRFGLMKENPEQLKFFVEDTGIGIAEDLAETIFKPFIQADSKSTRTYGGTGLGLSISRGLVKLLGGQIWLESKPGAGSTFYFTIPYHPLSRVEKKGKVSDHKEEIHQWKGKTILVVEDDDMNYIYLEEILAITGMNIIRAADGKQALNETTENNPELIIMDIRLPVMSGLDVTRRIRETGNKVPIIAQTAYAMSEDKSICLEAGCDDYVSKPIHKDLLLKKISYHLHRKKGFPAS